MAQHISIRVPWHDNGWNGCFCLHPDKNHACRVLKNIAENKDVDTEIQFSGQLLEKSENYQPPCARENGIFMSAKDNVCVVHHPYSPNEETHWDGRKGFEHIRDTSISLPAHSFTALPYRWMLRENAMKMMGLDENDQPGSNGTHFTGYQENIEPEQGKYNWSWVSNGINQKKIFDYFYANIWPKESFAVAYAKAVPFLETQAKVIIAVAEIESISDIQEYEYDHTPGEDEFHACCWERSIGHNLHKNKGILFPFAEIQKYLKEHPHQDPEELVITIPEAYNSEFSFATEHLSHDGLIYVLRRAIKVIRKCKELGISVPEGRERWCRDKLDQVWQDRGLYPGLGAVLAACGIPFASDIAYVIYQKTSNLNIWDKIPEIIENLKKYLPASQNKIAKILSATTRDLFLDRLANEKNIIKLLARFSLSADQAKLVLNPASVDIPNLEYLMDLDSEQLAEKALENPYILYEKTRLLPEKYRFSLEMIDLAMFLPEKLQKNLPNDELYFDEPDVRYRLRAIFTQILEQHADKGNTFVLPDMLLACLKNFTQDEVDLPALDLPQNIFTSKKYVSFFDNEFTQIPVHIDKKSNAIGLQLVRMQKIDKCIAQFVEDRVENDLTLDDDWKAKLNRAIGQSLAPDAPDWEKKSRKEQREAIENVISRSRLSVLTGCAGTGKTTTITAFCLNDEIRRGGILVLAPTGKARVVLEQKLRTMEVDVKAYTVFQYLLKSHHCDTETMSYYLSGKEDSRHFDTVIVDECSMLTEEMFGALAEAVSHAKRVILIGDPDQLPPIGTGRPFFDLVNYLSEKHKNRIACLNIVVRQRQGKEERLDVEFSRQFTRNRRNEIGEDIFNRVADNTQHIEIVKFSSIDELYETALPQALMAATGMENVDDFKNFEISLGGWVNKEFINFSPDWENTPKDIKNVEEWQIISPFRNNEEIGTSVLNQFIQHKYAQSRNTPHPMRKRTQVPLGTNGILYGEKVICIKNHDRSGYNGDKNEKKYIANGEIGIVEWTENPKYKKKPYHRIRFVSQPDIQYKWTSKIQEDCELELAYALTAHKVQGSGFNNTIFILNEEGEIPFISRELLYTALTRQRGKVWILYNKEPSELRKYGSDEYSELANRLTNLFFIPQLQAVIKKGQANTFSYYDDNLIHRTQTGDWVRSKSEVIVANALTAAGINYQYEEELLLPDGTRWHPDFTIKLGGKTIYWEHRGCMQNSDYKKHANKKIEIYKRNNISEKIGNLILTEDKDGSIDSYDIDKQIAKILKMK